MLEPSAAAEVEEEEEEESERQQPEQDQQGQQPHEQEQQREQQEVETQQGEQGEDRQQPAPEQQDHGSQLLQEGVPNEQGDICGLAHAQQAQQDGPPDVSSSSSSIMLACNGSTNPGVCSDSSRPASQCSSGMSSCGGSPAVQLSLHEAADGSLEVQLLPSSRQHSLSREQQEQPAVPGHSLQRPPQQQEQVPQQHMHVQRRGRRQGPAAAAGTAAEAAFSDVVSALLGPLSSDLLPPLSLRAIGWLLHQLLSVGKGGARLSVAQHSALAQAAARHRAALQQQLQGRWADALAPMVAAEWRRCREDILRAGAGSVHVAVQTWMQVGPRKGSKQGSP